MAKCALQSNNHFFTEKKWIRLTAATMTSTVLVGGALVAAPVPPLGSFSMGIGGNWWIGADSTGILQHVDIPVPGWLDDINRRTHELFARTTVGSSDPSDPVVVTPVLGGADLVAAFLGLSRSDC